MFIRKTFPWGKIIVQNQISKKQNEPQQIRRLAAQRKLYSRAKCIFTIRSMACLTIALCGATISSYHPSSSLIIALIALPYSFIDQLFLDPLQRKWIFTAAKIQEMFDTAVLELRWVAIKYGPPIDEEEVIELSTDIENNPELSKSLTNWYPGAIGNLPIHHARLVCQRANCVWDKSLRKRYSTAVIAILILAAIILFCIGLISDNTFEQLILSIIIPLAPAILLGLRQCLELRKSNTLLDKLSSDAHNTLQKSMREPVDVDLLTKLSRDIQSQLFDHRKNGQVIFDWVYKIFRTKNEHSMNLHAKTMADEASIIAQGN